MTYRRVLSWSTTWLFLPLLLVAVCLSAVSEREFFGDYPLVATSQAWICMVVVGPLVAGWTAWDASRLRPWLDATMGGAHLLKALIRALGPGFALGLVGTLSVVLVVTGRPASHLAWAVTFAAVLTFAAVALLGMALGMVLSKVAATPAAVALAYAAMAPAVADPSTRISRTVLTGAVAPCCSSSEQLNVRTLATVALAACLIGGMAVLSLVLTRSRRTRGAALTLGLALSAFLVWSATMGTPPMSQIETRTTAAVCNRNDGRMYCVWPEHARARPEIVRFASQAAAAAQTLGINLPTSWSEKETPNTMTFFWAMDATAREHKYALGVDIAHWLGCSSPDAESELASYLALTMGIPLDELANRDPITAGRVKAFAEMQPDDRSRFVRARAASCQQ